MLDVSAAQVSRAALLHLNIRYLIKLHHINIMICKFVFSIILHIFQIDNYVRMKYQVIGVSFVIVEACFYYIDINFDIPSLSLYI